VLPAVVVLPAGTADRAQTPTARIAGTVTDPTGAIVPASDGSGR